VGSARKKLIEAAQSMLAAPPCDESTALGAMVAAIGEQVVGLWQENVAVVEVFADMLTQWNVGGAGVVGLRYESLPLLLDLRAVPAADRPDLVAGLRVMERAALEHFRHG
jgi:hypothetical protein